MGAATTLPWMAARAREATAAAEAAEVGAAALAGAKWRAAAAAVLGLPAADAHRLELMEGGGEV